MAEKREKKDERELVPRASIKRIAERSISLIISEKGGMRALSLVSPPPPPPCDADGAAKLIFKRGLREASVRGVRSAP